MASAPGYPTCTVPATLFPGINRHYGRRVSACGLSRRTVPLHFVNHDARRKRGGGGGGKPTEDYDRALCVHLVFESQVHFYGALAVTGILFPRPLVNVGDSLSSFSLSPAIYLKERARMQETSEASGRSRAVRERERDKDRTQIRSARDSHVL